MPSWSIGYPKKERIEVELLSPSADDCGYDWVRACAHVSVGGFRADIQMMILAGDMRRFLEALEPVYRDLRGVAEFTTLEDQLRLKVEVDHVGHVRVTGHVKDQAGLGNRLNLEVTFDQTLLWHTVSELSEALSELQGNKR
ncbi:MAG TPA: hypothetical protein VNV43_14970 [Candidatus Acidoferrales bacterium]|jgi:hypothetical protein|nr:hypothetical protein [Candidatus Acidoferrales bacterium]